MPKIMLSAKGIRSIIYGDAPDFTFILQNHEEMRCKKIIADFISPIIASQHQSDITFDKFEFYIDGSPIEGITKNHVEQLIKLASGESIELSESDIVTMKIISVILGNEELLNILEESRHITNTNENKKIKHLQLQSIIIMPDEFSVSNIFQILKFYESRSIYSNKAIEYAAQNFEKIDKNQLKKLNHQTLLSIIKSKKLILESEDSLLDFILSIYDPESNVIKESTAELFESVSFENLSLSSFQKFVNIFDASYMTSQLLRQISYSFHCNPTEKRIELTNGSLGLFHGIIFDLTQKCGGNVHEKGVVNIQGMSIRDDASLHPQVAADLFDLQSCFHSRNVLNSTLTYDFKNIEITPTYYSIRSNPWGGKGHYHLMNWVVEGSNDNANWTLIDQRVDEKSLDALNGENSFKCMINNNDKEMSFRYLRIRNTGPNSGSNQILNHVMNIGALEFFGKIKYSGNRYL